MSAASYKIETLPVPHKLLGEGPHWDVRTQELLYVDVYAKSIYRFNPATGQERNIVITGSERGAVTFVIPVQSYPNKYLVAYAEPGHGGSIRLLEWIGGTETVQEVNAKELKILHALPAHDPPISFNDGKCDAKGRLWTGSLCVRVHATGFDLVRGIGQLHCLDINGQHSTHVDGIDLSNGLAWSPDNTQFYFIDSNTFRIDGFDYDLEQGTVANRHVVFDLKAHNIEGSPDGMCVDTDGNLWVAVSDGGIVIHVNPHTGEWINTIHFPCKKISSCVFGGRELDALYATSGCLGLSNEQVEASGAGALYKVTGIGVRGFVGAEYPGLQI